MTLTAVLILNLAAFAQTTEFTYQGQLQNASAPGNGSYDFEFVLFDGGGSQVGPVVPRNGVAVANGIFSVNLDFGSSFPGGTRFLEIRVRQAGGGAFTTLSPRQPVTSSPYSIKSLSTDNATNATQLGGLPASQYLQTNGNGSGLTNLNASSITTGTLANARLGQIPTANIADNAVTAPKIAAGQVVKTLNGLTDNVTLAEGTNITITPLGNTLTISSTGGGSGCPSPCTAAIFNATQQYNFAGSRILSSPGTNNLLVGVNTPAALAGLDNTYIGSFAGNASTSGDANTVVGVSAGFNTAGSGNSFFGRSAGLQNIGGENNSFFGRQAGRDNTGGGRNSFFGYQSGIGNSSGGNSFFGAETGIVNQGTNNNFFGASAGRANLDGNANNFFGTSSGRDLSSGSYNSFFGEFSGVGITSGSGVTLLGADTSAASNLTNATAIGANARVEFSNLIVLGSMAGVNGSLSDTEVSIGNPVGRPTRLSVWGGPLWTSSQWKGGVGLTNATAIGWTSNAAGNYFGIGHTDGGTYFFRTRAPFGTTNNPVITPLFIGDNDLVGIGTLTPNASLSVNGGATKPGGGSWGVFSDARLKDLKGTFKPGLKAVMGLRPLRYEYKRKNALDLKSEGEHVGFSAQEVEKLIPEAVTKDYRGYRIVNNDPIMWTMLNAIKEQQGMIEKLTRQVRQLQRANTRKKAGSRR